MHFHLPKPLHGWREFAGEVGIIVIGVLIALGAEQLVEALQWKAKAREAQTTIDAELGLTAGVFDVRGMMAPCEKQRLAQVLSVIAKARQSGQLPDVKGVAGGVTAPIVTTAWEGALSEGAVSHFAQKRRQEYAGLYNALGLYRSVMDEERRLYAHLRLVQNSPGKISDALLAEIATSNAELRDRTRLGDTIAEQGLVQNARARDQGALR